MKYRGLEFEKDDLPERWSEIVFKKIVKKLSLNGKKLKQKEYEEKGKLPVIDQGQDLIGGFTNKIELKIDCNLPVIVFGDHTKAVKFIEQNFVAGADGVQVLEPKSPLIPKLIYYFIQVIPLPNKGYARHYQYLEKTLIKIPPLKEQKRIVQKIESIFSRIDAARKSLDGIKVLLKQNRQSVLKSAFEGELVPQDPDDEPAEILLKRMHKDSKKELIFEKDDLPKGWVKTRLYDLSIINPKPEKNSIDDNLEVSFIPMKCVEELSGKIDLSNTRKFYEVKKGYTYFKNEDIIFAKITPCMENGKIAIARGLRNGIGYGSTEFHVIRLFPKISSEFYFYYLINDVFRKKAEGNMKGTAGQLRVPVDIIKEENVPLPPLNEQKRIVSKIELLFGRIDAIEKRYELKCAHRFMCKIYDTFNTFHMYVTS